MIWAHTFFSVDMQIILVQPLQLKLWKLRMTGCEWKVKYPGYWSHYHTIDSSWHHNIIHNSLSLVNVIRPRLLIGRLCHPVSLPGHRTINILIPKHWVSWWSLIKQICYAGYVTLVIHFKMSCLFVVLFSTNISDRATHNGRDPGPGHELLANTPWPHQCCHLPGPSHRKLSSWSTSGIMIRVWMM